MSSKILVTQSLLSDFTWMFRMDDGLASFLRTLRREAKPQSGAMLDGIEFEDAVTACAKNKPIDGLHKMLWIDCAHEVAHDCRGGQFQVRLSRDLELDGVTYVCYGVLDCLRAGEIIDIKYSKTYNVGKYRESPQHPMYFWLCPEARAFTYVVCDGEWVYRERYTPDITDHIETHIRDMVRWLKAHGLYDEYARIWAAKED